MSQKEILDGLAKRLLKINTDHKNKLVNDLGQSKEVESITKEGLLHNISPNQVLNYAMNNEKRLMKEGS